ncbi:hypothetical protein FX995_16970 [Pseudoalteromonas flavipulchra]|uniref:Uncharacterized protein n=1 Tax=Pseudoalteromonas maricaloris TaxID=184924 RepID=A0A8I2KS50_9GAMM|nr:hypothetical protein [Pseudoalteromonas flavipulchra]NLR23317.1 hypothetical protein [Pseudoalteromonas maricaloris]RZG09653.1 hypothetical protein EXT48_01070 [Pseudoalteromonas sp. CO348]RZG17868.1 hypothetical protein EXT47_01060 [Pseudoalteromonas sp. CO342X]
MNSVNLNLAIIQCKHCAASFSINTAPCTLKSTQKTMLFKIKNLTLTHKKTKNPQTKELKQPHILKCEFSIGSVSI